MPFTLPGGSVRPGGGADNRTDAASSPLSKRLIARTFTLLAHWCDGEDDERHRARALAGTAGRIGVGLSGLAAQLASDPYAAASVDSTDRHDRAAAGADGRGGDRPVRT